jgi:hypothetical protein
MHRKNKKSDNLDNLKVRCPRCGRWVAWENNPYRPFCSEKCRLVDLGRWAGEEYRIHGPKTDSEEEQHNIIDFPKKS